MIISQKSGHQLFEEMPVYILSVTSRESLRWHARQGSPEKAKWKYVWPDCPEEILYMIFFFKKIKIRNSKTSMRHPIFHHSAVS